MTLGSALGVISASLLALASGVFCVASSMSLGATDPKERKDAAISALWSLITLALCAAAILTLTGCMSARELACLARDNTSRPCN